MKITKTSYKILTHEGWKEQKGSVGYDYPFFLYKEDNSKSWCLSHMASGYSIKKSITLKKGKEMINKLKAYDLFLLPCSDTINKAKNKLPQKELNEILKIVNGD